LVPTNASVQPKVCVFSWQRTWGRREMREFQTYHNLHYFIIIEYYVLYSRVHKTCNNLRIKYWGVGDFVATFGLYNTKTYRFYCSFLVQYNIWLILVPNLVVFFKLLVFIWTLLYCKLIINWPLCFMLSLLIDSINYPTIVNVYHINHFNGIFLFQYES